MIPKWKITGGGLCQNERTGGRRSKTGRYSSEKMPNRKRKGRRRCQTERGEEGEDAKPKDGRGEKKPNWKITRGRMPNQKMKGWRRCQLEDGRCEKMPN